jgi:hypothetical protein
MADMIKEYRQAHPWCQVSTCGRAADDVHHIRSQACYGSDAPSNLLSLCREHHGEVHAMGVHSFAAKYTHLARKIAAALDAPRV